MKARLNTLCLALMAVASVYAHSLTASCRTFADSQVTLTEQIRNDLLRGVWTVGLPSARGEKVRRLLQFRPAGRLDVLELRSQGNYDRREFNWILVEGAEDHPHLRLYDVEQHKSLTYGLQQTCAGLELINAETGERLQLDFNAPGSLRALAHLQEMLVGEWTNSVYPFEIARTGNRQMAGAFLYYRFNADGSYIKSLGNSEAQLDEMGAWEISADGQYLLLHSEEFQGGRMAKKTTIARIKFVMFDEMVLEHSLRVNDESFCTEQKDFYFSKV